MEDSKGADQKNKQTNKHKKARARKMEGRITARHPGEEEEEEWWRSGSRGVGDSMQCRDSRIQSQGMGRKRNGQQG